MLADVVCIKNDLRHVYTMQVGHPSHGMAKYVGNTAWNHRMTAHDKLERKWKEKFMTYFK
jgi:hypothetical protein